MTYFQWDSNTFNSGNTHNTVIGTTLNCCTYHTMYLYERVRERLSTYILRGGCYNTL